MKCPFCNALDSTKVTDSRTVDDGKAIKRRRMCELCNERFTTYERVDEIQMTVIKRNGSRETFNRAKIFNSVIRACNKRTVTSKQIEQLVDETESSFANSMRREIPTCEIGEIVMTKLKKLDEVSYVRFASVYREFKDIDSFMDELSKLLHEKGTSN
ncbi:MAG: transcriptional regulator NrdR [Clostridiales bacterium]|jgi:transcriptional repressor NrdR|nr:transcriptional regulator NrdR [Clostridiales bacterium]